MAVKREIDRLPLPNPRPVELEVLCLGFSRTGTMSMYTAMNKLGLKSYHFLECSLHNIEERHLECWNEAYTRKLDGDGQDPSKEDFDKILGKYAATTDAPCVNFSDALMKYYPNAKIILTDRDIDKWIKSVDNSFYRALEWPLWRWIASTHPRFETYVQTLILVLRAYAYPGAWNDREALKAGYRRHYAHIREVVPKENLLEYNFGDGWEPICKFLDKPVPDEPYPFINEGDNTHKMHMKIFYWQSVMLLGKGLVYGVLPVALGVWGWRQGWGKGRFW